MNFRVIVGIAGGFALGFGYAMHLVRKGQREAMQELETIFEGGHAFTMEDVDKTFSDDFEDYR